MKIREHDTVALIEDIPAEKLSKGDVGAVVHIYHGGAAFEVEFFDERGKTKAVATVPAPSVLRLNMMSLSA
jgi:hypothetical protein